MGAGTSALIEIFADDPTQQIQVQVMPEYPEGILVHPIHSSNAKAPRFRVEVTPEFVTGDKPVGQKLTFAASIGGVQQKLMVELEIGPPDLVRLPGEWVRSPNCKLIKIGAYYPKEIERAVGGVNVTALLIERRPAKPGAIQPDPFYIMKDKVWVELFGMFAREHPELVKDSAWHQGSNPRLPVYNVTGPQAQAFAEWLGGSGHGFLPTPEQWDQAAGRNLVNAGVGPYEGPWNPEDPKQVAVGVNRREPMPVGHATQDRSPYGCQDMSGNGWEWTRPRPGDKPDELVALRAQNFKGVRPFVFDDIKNDEIGAKGFNECDDVTGFRVVIELDPSG
jgi:formylglycine-generating enzyme required for sulfatase activity